MDTQDKVLQFVAYSNTDMDQIHKNSPKATSGGKFNFSDQSLKSGEPEIASLSKAIGGESKPGGFAAMLNKKK